MIHALLPSLMCTNSAIRRGGKGEGGREGEREGERKIA